MADVTNGPLRIAVIIGSTRDGRFGPVVADWITEHIAQREDMTADLVDLVATPLPTAFPAFGQTPSDEVVARLGAVSPRLAEADGFVIVTPEYNHSFPAPLKNAIDWHNEQWHAKPVGFVSYGGLAGGLRAAEQLRVVLAELHAVTIRGHRQLPQLRRDLRRRRQAERSRLRRRRQGDARPAHLVGAHPARRQGCPPVLRLTSRHSRPGGSDERPFDTHALVRPGRLTPARRLRADARDLPGDARRADRQYRAAHDRG